MDIKVLASSSAGNCYRIDDGKTAILLEAGLPFKEIQRRLNFHTAALDGVLVTHEHMDHAKAVKDMLKVGIHVYMSQGTEDALNVTGAKIIKAKQQFKIGSWTILPFETQHDVAEPLGYLLASGREKLLFATDTFYVKYRFRGLTHIMIECNYSADILQGNVESGAVPTAMKNRLLKSHFSLEHVKEFLKANDLNGVREIHLLHLSDGNSDAERFQKEIAGMTGKPVYVAERG